MLEREPLLYLVCKISSSCNGVADWQRQLYQAASAG
jgi:hypothetical protein